MTKPVSWYTARFHVRSEQPIGLDSTVQFSEAKSVIWLRLVIPLSRQNLTYFHSEPSWLLDNVVNKLDPFYATMHSMGLFYTKDSEGSLYPNAPINLPQVMPSSRRLRSLQMVNTFNHSPTSSTLTIPFRLVAPASAPDPGYDSKLWAYHSYVSMYQDADAGLSGPWSCTILVQWTKPWPTTVNSSSSTATTRNQILSLRA